MNENNLQKVDYLLASIPVFIFIFPILVLGGAFFNWYDVEYLITPLILLYMIIIVLLSSIGWGYKFILKIKHNEERKKELIVVYSCFAIAVGIFEGWLLFLIFDTFLSLYRLEGTTQVLWVILLGFFYVMIFKVLSDLHHLPEAYDNVIDWFHTKLD